MSTEQDSVRRPAEIGERAPLRWETVLNLYKGDAVTAGRALVFWMNDLSESRKAAIDSLTAERDRLAAAGCPRCGPPDGGLHIAGGLWSPVERIPAPVVPSDDERCGWTDANYRPPCLQARERHCAIEGHLWRDPTCPLLHGHEYAPPTPSQDAESVRSDSDRPQRSLSQDAEGDGLERVVDSWVSRAGQATVIGHGAMLTFAREVESAIREPYEALVNAARAVVEGAELIDSREASVPWSKVEALAAELESLGGRKDG